MNKFPDILVVSSDRQARLDKEKYKTENEKAKRNLLIFSIAKPCVIILTFLAFMTATAILAYRSDLDPASADSFFTLLPLIIFFIIIFAVVVFGFWILEDHLIRKQPDKPMSVEWLDFKEKNRVIDIIIKPGTYSTDIAKVKFIYEDSEHIINNKDFTFDVKYKTDMQKDCRAILDFDIGVLFYPYEKYTKEMEKKEND